MTIALFAWHLGHADAVLHPVLIDPKIEQCDDWSQGPCSAMVYYTAAGSQLADVAVVAPPVPNAGTRLMAVGMHCTDGNAQEGKPFYGCRFTNDSGHTPGVTNCYLRSTDSWELTQNSTCALENNRWGPHTGAGPGGECIIFVQTGGWSTQLANTIHGVLSPDAVANSGNAFCQKSLPPSVTCTVLLPDTIDHGTIEPNQQSSARVEGTINCGTAPVVTIAGGSRMTLALGVTTELSAQTLGGDRLQITSNLVSTNGEAGQHSASTVILVSPY
jgi:hypothetical protein